MIYIVIDAKNLEQENTWVRENADLGCGDTFVENFKGKCVISLPDSDSPYNQKMVEHFGYSEEMPELTEM